MGLNFCPDFLEEGLPGEKNTGSIAAIVRHAKHIINVGGAECIGLGSDFDGIEGHGELPDFSYMPKLWDALQKSGFGEGELEKIFLKMSCGFIRRHCLANPFKTRYQDKTNIRILIHTVFRFLRDIINIMIEKPAGNAGMEDWDEIWLF